MAADSTLAAIRESFGRVVYTHKTHQKMIDRLNKRNKLIKIANLVALVLTTGGILAPIYDGSPYKNVIVAVSAAIALGVSIYQLSFDPSLEVESHRKCAKQLWIVREKYINMIADIKDGILTDVQIRQQRDALVDELGRIYQDAPDTTPGAYATAQKALKVRQEMMFSVQEIDQFLPVHLRENNS